MSDSRQVITVGAGLAGSLLAILLGRRGYQVRVYERRADMRRALVPRGRSINLALSTRGLHALELAGVKDAVMREAIPMRGRMIHDRDGRQSLQPYSIHPHECIYSVSRHGLNVALLDVAEQTPGVRLAFAHRCRGMDLERGIVHFTDEASGAEVDVQGGPVIATDGAFSAIRAQMQKQDRFDYQQQYLEWGYKELTIPPGADGRHRLSPNALHIWPRRDFMLIALPNADGSFTCTLFLPFEGVTSFARLRSDADVRAFFEAQFADAAALMPTLLDDYRHNPTSSLVYLRCAPWHVAGRVALLGDACHAVVPFYGQGMNAAFEDCAALDRCVERLAPDWEAVFATYQGLRKRNTDALADLALQNFVAMRDGVISPLYRLHTGAEKLMHRLFPDDFLPLYSMVTFSRIPYAEAVARSRRQDAWLAAAGVAAGLGLGAWGLGALRRRRGRS